MRNLSSLSAKNKSCVKKNTLKVGALVLACGIVSGANVQVSSASATKSASVLSSASMTMSMSAFNQSSMRTASFLSELRAKKIDITSDAGSSTTQSTKKDTTSTTTNNKPTTTTVKDNTNSSTNSTNSQNTTQSSSTTASSNTTTSSESSSTGSSANAATSNPTVSSSTSVVTKEPTLSKPVSTFGQFDASVYGYTGADRIKYWQSINPDVIGYLRIPGTNISHPVVQNRADVNYYLNLNMYKNYDKNGVIWTNPDTNSTGRASEISDNTVFYGHNWKNISANPRILSSNDVMFEQLTSYHHADMGRTYPYIYYSSLEEEMTFVIFATFYTEIDFNYIQTEGANDYIIQEALSRSRNTFGVDVNGSDKIITLSTCTRAYGKSDRQRFVVMARMLRPGETISPIEVTYNPNHKQPSNL